MARLSRDKGQRIERELVHLHLDAGIPASRVPLSGAAGERFISSYGGLSRTACQTLSSLRRRDSSFIRGALPSRLW